MTVNQILDLDCRLDDNCKVIQEYLRKIKPLAKYKITEDVPICKIEKVITVLSKKYNIRVREFVPDMWSNDDETIWKAILIDDRNLLQIKVSYGLSLYEILAKVAIYMYSVREVVGKRKES